MTFISFNKLYPLNQDEETFLDAAIFGDEDVIDITQLTDSQEETEKAVEGLDDKFNKVISLLNDFETMIVETLMGKSDYIRAAKRNNFGIAQIRPETAKDVLKNIKKKNINDYYYIISLKNSNLSLKQNLLSNVHFSIAICAEFYALKKIKRLDSKHLRAQVWKRFYNTKKGSGTVDAYVKRVTKYYASL